MRASAANSQADSAQEEAETQPAEMRRDLRSILLMAFVVVWTFVGATCALASLIFDSSARAFHSVARWWARVLLRASGVRVEAEGVENVDPNRSYVFMSNHQSHYDIVAIVASLPVQLRFIAKKELFKIPIFGYAMRRGGHIRIDRDNLRQAFASYDIAAERIQEGTSVMIFAEGTRSPEGRVQPFKKGGFVLALKAGVPIVPITASGGRKILPKGRFVFRKGIIKLVVDKPIETSSHTFDNKEELVNRVRKVIISNLREDGA